MKKLSKVLVLVLSAIMVLAMSASVFAAEIDVQNVLDGETYTAYKILNYTDNGKTGVDRSASYFLSAEEYTAIGSVLEAAGFAFTASSDGSRYTVNNADAFDPAAAAEYLHEHVADLGDALGKTTATGSNGEAAFTDLGTGYFFVTTTAGSLCALHEDTGIATVVEKNTVPAVDKKQGSVEGTYADAVLHMNMGDTVYYQLEVTDGIGTDAAITLTDTMSEGLTYTAGSLKINGTAVADDADTDNWKVTVNGQVITIVLKAAYVETLEKTEKATITYAATINEKAVVDSDNSNKNNVELAYSQQTSEDAVYVETYDFVAKKVDKKTKEFLDGAEFTLWDAETGGNQIKFSSDNTGLYKDDNGTVTNIDINDATGVNVRGLAPGTYYLEEVVTPEGYNQLATRTPVTVEAGQTAAVEVVVENESGTVLPGTGGIGTTIFYILGSALVIGCGIVLISRKRMQNK